MDIIINNSQTSDYLKNFDIDGLATHTHTDEIKYLSIIDSKLTLLNNGYNLTIDFNDKDIQSRIDPKSKKCSVVQAVEGRSKSKLKILDTTAGLGRDTFTLASRGHLITAIEKNPYIYLLLLDAIERAKKDPNLVDVAKNITLLNADSSDYILSSLEVFDCVYVDPMFPERKKSAKVKQNMQIMHEIAFNDENINTLLLENAFKKNIAKKVIVKRPINAEYLSAKKPSAQIKGKTNRFDIYSISF
ncbi:class I SAM-dependent methyltransferase [Francisellaceae bacterium CB300]|jgi:16S rRNA (guanine1516-N2)-methyltransferase